MVYAPECLPGEGFQGIMLGRFGRLSTGHIPVVRAMSRGPMQYTTRFLQTAHTRHHTMLSPMMSCGSRILPVSAQVHVRRAAVDSEPETRRTLMPRAMVIIHDCFPTAFSSDAMLSAGSYVGDKRPFVASESIWLTLSRFHTKAHM